MPRPTKRSIRAFASERLGLDALRPGQEAAMLAVLGGKDTLAIMPTGSGKSAIYQVAGGLLGGLAIVISPLIALQRDQVDNLREIDPSLAAELNSSLGDAEREEVLRRVREGDVSFLFLAPEQLANDETMALLAHAAPKLVVVDEAHCVSDWGHDFRPDYLHLDRRIAALGNPTTLALTATANPRVREEIIERLGMEEPEVIVQDFDRPNIALAVERFTDPEEKLDALLDAVVAATPPGIVYVARRRDAEAVADALCERGIAAAPYHAGLKSSERDHLQDAFMDDEVQVMVATIAFGMGIDKPNVRFVHHHDVSDSIDAYYQEIGRAGRDGEPAEARLFYVAEDLKLRRFQSGAGQVVPDEVAQVFQEIRRKRNPVDPTALRAKERADLSDTALTRIIDRLDDIDAITIDPDGMVQAADRKADPETVAREAAAQQDVLRQYERSRLEMMWRYAELDTCRRAFILRYFGQEAPDRCENCDVCLSTEARDLPEAAGPFPPNAVVNHREWGEGQVMVADGETVTVRFDSVGYKVLDLELVQANGLLTAADEAMETAAG